MPVYEYECKKCGRVVEAYQKFSDVPLKKCDRCSGRLQKLISHSTFHLKGSGWYVTDYANRSGGAASSSGGKDKTISGEKGERKGKKAASSGKGGSDDSV